MDKEILIEAHESVVSSLRALRETFIPTNKALEIVNDVFQENEIRK